MVKTAVPDFTHPEEFEFIHLLDSLRKKRSVLLGAARPLAESEIVRLKKNGNTAEDWAALRVTDGFNPATVAGSRFFGTCVLGVFDGTPVECTRSLSLPTGIHDSIIINSVIGNNCCIWNARGVSNYFLDDTVVLYNTGTVSCSSRCTFGNGMEIIIGMETGGRELLSCADITLPVAEAVITGRSVRDKYNSFVNVYLNHVTGEYGIIGSKTRICNCLHITDTFFGEAVRCERVTRVSSSTILGSSEEPTTISDGALVCDSIVQWGCTVSSMAIVDRSICTEHSRVERHGKVTCSIIGPNTGIAEGEVTASLVGPFTGFHHQALLIGALWPRGRGNVAYGANVGSNHTAKAPDQEIYCGEGLFFGLGTNIKFPADFSRAPYTIIATGVTTPPQRMTFPFSLINVPSRRVEPLPSSYNELVPGWVLSDNLYAVYRNETKFGKRDISRRHGSPGAIFGPAIIDLIVAARNALRSVNDDKDIYTEGDLPGAGKNFITRGSLVRAVETYSLHIEYYCLNGLYHRCSGIAEGRIPTDYDTLLTIPSGNSDWEHQRNLINSEGLSRRSLHENLIRLAELVAVMAASVATAKAKDDLRGRTIMDDYEAVHGSAAEDTFVRQTQADCAATIREIREFGEVLEKR